MAAANREDFEIAANRWEKLLGMNPPENIRETLAMNVSIWRGEEPAPPVQATPAAEETVSETITDAILTARVALSEEAMRAIGRDAVVFVIARDPVVPTPPIAGKRRTDAASSGTVRGSRRRVN